MWRKVLVASLGVLIAGMLHVSLIQAAADLANPKPPDSAMVGTSHVCLTVNSTTGECEENVQDVFDSFGTIVTAVARVLIIGAAIIFMAIVFRSGYVLVFKADKQKELQSIKQNLTTGLIGLVLVTLAWWIVILVTTVTGTSGQTVTGNW